MSQLINGGTARIGQANHATDLVKSLARCIVAGGTDLHEIGIATHFNQRRMTARYHHGQKGRLQLWIGQISRRHVCLDMIDRHQRDVVSKGQRFGKIHADQQCADQSGSGGDRHSTDIRQRHTCRVQRLMGNAGHGLDMSAAGDLGHDTAIQTVGLDLRGHDIRSDATLPCFHLHDGRRGLVTGAFDSQNIH